jgi:hypothetical protein
MKMDYLSDSDTVSDQELASNLLQESGSDSSISDVEFLDSDTASSDDLQAARMWVPLQTSAGVRTKLISLVQAKKRLFFIVDFNYLNVE